VIKFLIRPNVIKNEYTGLIKTIALSYPNFCEAIVGSIFITFILLVTNGKFGKKGVRLEEKWIPLISILTSGVYVLLQEFKIHNIGGANVYDPCDVIFSILGLIVSFCLLIYIKPKYIVE
jgi:hypothetical protein